MVIFINTIINHIDIHMTVSVCYGAGSVSKLILKILVITMSISISYTNSYIIIDIYIHSNTNIKCNIIMLIGILVSYSIKQTKQVLI